MIITKRLWLNAGPYFCVVFFLRWINFVPPNTCTCTIFSSCLSHVKPCLDYLFPYLSDTSDNFCLNLCFKKINTHCSKKSCIFQFVAHIDIPSREARKMSDPSLITMTNPLSLQWVCWNAGTFLITLNQLW